jgi:hypothetical protein
VQSQELLQYTVPSFAFGPEQLARQPWLPQYTVALWQAPLPVHDIAHEALAAQ